MMNYKLILFLLFIILTTSLSFGQNDSTFTIGKITIKGDKITHKPIIYRELEFSEGEVISMSNLEEKIKRSKSNLLNRSLFNFVTIDKIYKNNICDIVVTVTERWYIWPIPIIEYADRNFNVWWETKDLSRLNIGLDLRIENFRGRMENLNLIFQGGYDQMLAVRWQLPYITKNQVFGMGFEGGFLRNHEIAIESVNNKLVFYRLQESFVRKLGFASVNATFRPEFNYLHQFSLRFNHLNLEDSVLFYNPNYTYGETIYDYFTISYSYKQDFRDFKPYPLKGYYLDIRLSKIGLGILSDDVNQFTADVNFDHYIPLAKRWNFAYRFSGRYTWTGDFQPYFLAEGIGLSDFEVRGYELYLINGQNLGVFKSNLKFTIIPKTNFDIKWIKSDKFGKVFFGLYTNLFFDMGYADDRFFYHNNPLNNQFLWGSGIGVDFVSYYDIVLRFEFSVNKRKETGFYFSMTAPI